MCINVNFQLIHLQHNTTYTVAYLGGGPRCDGPPFGPTMKIFLQATLYEKVRFFVIFQQELQNSTMFYGLLRFQISEKWANLRFPLNIQKQKVFQLQGGFPL